MKIKYSELYQPTIKYREYINEIDEILETEEILYVISKNIILYRKENKLTQQQLANRIEVNQSMISKLESGNYNPTFKEIYKITVKLTHESNLYKRILEEIIDGLNKYEKMQYNMSINYNKNEENMDNQLLYKIINKNNIEYINSFKGEIINEGNYSEISNVG